MRDLSIGKGEEGAPERGAGAAASEKLLTAVEELPGIPEALITSVKVIID